MFYFKGQKKEIRRPIIKVFSELNLEAMTNDNFVVISKLIDPNQIKLIRLYCGVETNYPKNFGFVDYHWNENQTECIGLKYYFFEKTQIHQEIKNVDGLFYEFVTINVKLVKEFKSKMDYLCHRDVGMDMVKSDYLFLLEEQVIDDVLQNNGLISSIKNTSQVSNTLFQNMEYLISQSMKFKNRLAS